MFQVVWLVQMKKKRMVQKNVGLLSEHNLAQQHVFESGYGLGAVCGVITFKGFVEIGIGSLEILFLSM